MTTALPQNESPSAGLAAGRLRSLDALRGFDMLMIAGGAEAAIGLSRALGLDGLTTLLREQTIHPEWHGFTAWDLIFPLFLFLAGVSMPFSFAKRRAGGATRGELARHAVRRGVLLVALGLVYNGFFGPALFGEEGRPLRYASVLGRIGLAWMFAAFVMLFVERTRWILVAIGTVLAAHALLLAVPAPGLDAVSLAPGETFPDWIDRHIVPGRLHMTVRDPEGLVGVMPAIGTALLGVLAGRWLSAAPSAARAAGGLVGLGVLCLTLGQAAALVGLPINKNLWTASFVLWAGGWSFLLLAVFHAVFDGPLATRFRFDRVALAFTVLGANAILVYICTAFVSWGGLAEVLFARALERQRLSPLFIPLVGVCLQWCVFYALYRRRIFLRV